MSLKRSLYTLFLYFFFPLVLVRLLVRSRSNTDYRKRWSERLGFVSNQNNSPVIWVHAVSVGEVIAAKPLIDGLLKKYSNNQILITTTTPTGSDRVKALFSNHIHDSRVQHTYFPYDLLGSVSRFVKGVKPQILIVVETEIWPNLYAKCYQQKIPVVMINARLSDKSTQSYLKIKGLVAETLFMVKVISVRSKIDAERFTQLGAKPSQILESGNIKYDISRDVLQEVKAEKYLKVFEKEGQNGDLVFVAASTHKGEDEKILFIYLSLLKQYPNLKLVLVPRHPERFNDVYAQCLEQLPKQLKLFKHSQIEQSIEQNIESNGYKPNVVLGDSMGEMQMWFAMADVVFIGGSLVEVGGHNPLEATVFGLPVVSGPHMFNFEDIAKELSSAELLFVCEDEFEITKKLDQILKNIKHIQNQSSELDPYEEKSKMFMQQHQGVTARLLKVIERELI